MADEELDDEVELDREYIMLMLDLGDIPEDEYTEVSVEEDNDELEIPTGVIQGQNQGEILRQLDPFEELDRPRLKSALSSLIDERLVVRSRNDTDESRKRGPIMLFRADRTVPDCVMEARKESYRGSSRPF